MSLATKLAFTAITVAVAALPAAAQGKPRIDTPTITCGSATENTITLQICAGATGAPAGFSVQWMTEDDFELGPDGLPNTVDDNSWFASDDPRLCKASFSGNANQSAWNLTANACTNVVIGALNDTDPGVSFSCNSLVCETTYVFRAFAHATRDRQRSNFTVNQSCTTASCQPTGFNDGAFCTKSQGFFSSGNAGRTALLGLFGGDATGVLCTTPSGVTMVTIGSGTRTMSWVTTGACDDVQPGPQTFLLDTGIIAMRTALGGGGASGQLPVGNAINPLGVGTGGNLASQTAALTLNLTLNGAAFGAATLCNFEQNDTFQNNGTPISAATAAALNGQTIVQVLAATNAYLGGGAVPYGLPSGSVLNELISNLNLSFHDAYVDPSNVPHDCGKMNALAQSHLCSGS